VQVERIPRNDDQIQLRLAGVVVDDDRLLLDEQLLSCSHYNRHVLVSLRDVTLLNSQGIGLLLSVHRTLDASGGKMVLYEVPVHVRQVIDYMKLDHVLRIAGGQQQAEAMVQ
jgi:anti-anti-sigma factor